MAISYDTGGEKRNFSSEYGLLANILHASSLPMILLSRDHATAFTGRVGFVATPNIHVSDLNHQFKTTRLF